MIISAEEAREIQNKVNGNEEQLLRIQEQIKKEAAKKKHSFGFIFVENISDVNLQLLKDLGYYTEFKYDEKECKSYYLISWTVM